jgi:hypothetical protein
MVLLILGDGCFGCEGESFAVRVWQSRRRAASMVVNHVGVREEKICDGHPRRQ